MTRSLLLFSGLLLLLTIKGDGHFPLPSRTPELGFQVWVLALTSLFGAGLVCLVQRTRAHGVGESPPLRTAAAIAAAFMLLDGGVLLLEAQRYASFGYAWRPVAAILICLLPASASVWFAMRTRPVNPAALLALAAVAHGALCLYACAYFPLAAGRSDMVPLLLQGGRQLLAGHDPYTLYSLTPGSAIHLTYLPGLLFAYLPAALMRLDPRIVELVYTITAARLLHLGAGSGAAAFLSPFLVSPYLVYRHDAYLAPFWLLLVISWAVLSRARPAAIAVTCGILAVTSQLLVIPALAMAVFGFKRNGRSAMLRGLLPVAAACSAMLGFFILPDVAAFFSGTVGHWHDALNIESLGITYWLLFALSPAFVHTLQAVVVIALLSIPRPRLDTGEMANHGLPGVWPPPPVRWLPRIDPDDPRSVFAAASLALFAFAALNTVIWTYFYLPVLFLAMLSQLDRASIRSQVRHVAGDRSRADEPHPAPPAPRFGPNPRPARDGGAPVPPASPDRGSGDRSRRANGPRSSCRPGAHR